MNNVNNSTKKNYSNFYHIVLGGVETINLIDDCLTDWEDEGRTVILGIETSGSMFRCTSTDIVLPSDLYVRDESTLYLDSDDRDLNIEFYKEKNYAVKYSKTNDKICGIRVKDDEIVFTITGCEIAY